jgi:RimJ/RimL family protein N-acetyltransferase
MLLSTRIALTPLRESDLPLLFRWINDRELVTLNAPYKPVSEQQHRAWFEDIQKRRDTRIFAIRLLENDVLVGTCQLHTIDLVHRAAELQIRIGDGQHRGRGIGTEAVRLLLGFAFEDLDLHRVYLHVFASNQPALRLYEKVGFRREGVLREAAHIEGKYVDVVVMGILRSEVRPEQP